MSWNYPSYQNSTNDLPPGWEMIIDPRSGVPFYADHNTQTTTWVKPQMAHHRNYAPNRVPNVYPDSPDSSGMRVIPIQIERPEASQPSQNPNLSYPYNDNQRFTYPSSTVHHHLPSSQYPNHTTATTGISYPRSPSLQRASPNRYPQQPFNNDVSIPIHHIREDRSKTSPDISKKFANQQNTNCSPGTNVLSSHIPISHARASSPRKNEDGIFTNDRVLSGQPEETLYNERRLSPSPKLRTAIPTDQPDNNNSPFNNVLQPNQNPPQHISSSEPNKSAGFASTSAVQQPPTLEPLSQSKPVDNATLRLQEISNIKIRVENLQNRVGNFSGTKSDKEYLFLDETLTKGLLLLDNITIEGNDNVRVARRDAVKFVHSLLDELELKAFAAAQSTADNCQHNVAEPNTGQDVVEDSLTSQVPEINNTDKNGANYNSNRDRQKPKEVKEMILESEVSC